MTQKTFSGTMPLLFLGHGSPMNAIEVNAFTQTLSALKHKLPAPKGILVISAHWMTKGTWVTGMNNPETIHDFYGFPEELFNVQYHAPGNPELASQIARDIVIPEIQTDMDQWGLDHGTWSVLRHLYPEAKIPVLQLSLDMSKPYEFHFELGQKIRYLREQGILVIGSGNIVHNLKTIRWEPGAKPYDWAIEFDEWIKSALEKRDFQKILTQSNRSSILPPLKK
jgi:4,5-DOPA dioxygenase extradiol